MPNTKHRKLLPFQSVLDVLNEFSAHDNDEVQVLQVVLGMVIVLVLMVLLLVVLLLLLVVVLVAVVLVVVIPCRYTYPHSLTVC